MRSVSKIVTNNYFENGASVFEYSIIGEHFSNELRGLYEIIQEGVDNNSYDNSIIRVDLTRADQLEFKPRRLLGYLSYVSRILAPRGVNMSLLVSPDHETLFEDLYSPLDIDIVFSDNSQALTQQSDTLVPGYELVVEGYLDPAQVSELLNNYGHKHFAARVVSRGVRLVLNIDPNHDFDQISSNLASLNFSNRLKWLDDQPEVIDNVGLLCLFDSGNLHGVGKIEMTKESGLYYSIPDGIQLIDTGISDPSTCSSRAIVFATLL